MRISYVVVSGWSARLAVAACTLSLAACQEQLITETEPDLPPPPPFTKSCESERKDLFTAATGPGPGPATKPPDTGVLRSRHVTVNFDVLEAAMTPGDVLWLNLFEDVCFDAVLERISTSGPNPDLRGWVGSIPGDQFSTVVLASSPGVLSGTVAPFQDAYPRAYQVYAAGRPVHAVYEIDQRARP